MTASLYETTGLGISLFRPTIDLVTPAYQPAGVLITDAFSEKVTDYNHEINADGGWWSASMSCTATATEIESWMETGLNRHIEIYGPGQKIWEGFVNQVSILAGTLTATRGPLMDVINRASVVYTPILDPTTVPPIEGTETTTLIADNATSQAAYGIMEGIIAGGKLLDDGVTDDAVQLRNTYLEENKDPQTGEALDFSGGSGTTITIDCLGYVHRFQKYVYQNLAAATIQLDTKIQNIIAADPNGLFSTDYSRITANATLTSGYEDDNRTAWDVLQQEIQLGNAAYNRCTLGVYDHRQIIYQTIPTTAKYQHYMFGNELQVELVGGGVPVNPWSVLPAQWVFLADLLAPKGRIDLSRIDARYMFIEAVRYTTPNLIRLTGEKVSRLPQMIARLSG